MISRGCIRELLLSLVLLQILMISARATTTKDNNNYNNNKKAGLRARANTVITNHRKLDSGHFSSSSSDDVRREVVQGGAKEKLRLSIPEDISTPDNTYFGGIRGVAYDKKAKVYYVLSDDIIQFHRPPTESPSVAPSENTTSNLPSPMPSTAPSVSPSTSPTASPSGAPSLATQDPFTYSPSSSPTMSRETVEHKSRYYTVKFDEGKSVEVIDVTFLKNNQNEDYQAGDVMPLDIAYVDGRMFIALDQEYGNTPQASLPLLVEYNITSGFVRRSFDLPPFFRFNTPFTGISVNAAEQKLYAATSTGLRTDEVNDIRITEFDLGTWQAGAQYVYKATNPVVGLESIDENGGFLVLERDQLPPPPTLAPTAMPSTANANWEATDVTLSNRGLPSEPRFDVHLYYVLSLDALNVASVTELKSQNFNAMRRSLVEEWTNTTLKIDAMGMSRDSHKYAKQQYPYSVSKDDYEEDPYERQRRLSGDDVFEIILMTDNDFDGPTDVLFVELDVKETPLLTPTKETADIIDSTGQAGNVAKDPAIWVHPNLPEYSLVLGASGTGGVTVYDLLGNIRQIVNPGGDQTAVDVLYAFQLKPENLEDVAVVADRSGQRLRFYRIFHDISGGQYLTDITDYSSQPSLSFPRSVATYTSPFTAKHYAIVQSGDNRVVQIELKPTSDNQRIMGTSIRTIELDGNAGGLVVDQELGFLYVSLDGASKGIVKYDAEPNEFEDSQNYPQTTVEGNDKALAAQDIAGMTIYYGAKGDGFLVVSVSGDSTFAVFERQKDNDYYDSFTVRNNQEEGIDKADTLHGIDIMNVNLGPGFTCGLLVVQDSDNELADVKETSQSLVNSNSNFKLVPFEALSSYLSVDTDSWGPRRFALVIWVNTIAQDIYAALNEDKLTGRDTAALLDLLNDVTYYLYSPSTRKQQMISLGDDPLEGHRRGHKHSHREQRSLLEGRRQESRRRLEEDQQRTPEQRRELKKDDCKRRRLTFDGDDARDGLTEFLEYLITLKSNNRFTNIEDTRVQYWMDLATEVRTHMPYAEY